MQISDFSGIIILIVLIFGLITINGTRYYKLDSTCLRIKSSGKFLSGQEVLILFGSVSCVAIPLLCMISCPSITKSLFTSLLSSPMAIICFLLMILCPIGIVAVSIYIIISNLIKSHKPNFIKEIVLDKDNNIIKVCSNVCNKIIPFEDVICFSVYTTVTSVPNVRPGVISARMSIGNKLSSNLTDRLIAARAANTGNVDVITNIEIVIHTVNDGVIKINTLGNIIFDPNSQKLSNAIMEYKTKFKNFIFNSK